MVVRSHQLIGAPTCSGVVYLTIDIPIIFMPLSVLIAEICKK